MPVPRCRRHAMWPDGSSAEEDERKIVGRRRGGKPLPGGFGEMLQNGLTMTRMTTAIMISVGTSFMKRQNLWFRLPSSRAKSATALAR